VFDSKKPTVLLLGRWQPWHGGHFALFERAIKKTGQVAILVRDLFDKGDKDNPFKPEIVFKRIEQELYKKDYIRGEHYEIFLVPNITNITYGRDVGYSLEEEEFDEETKSISATQIRKKMREEGKLS
tara:strand:- start:392 stop:772 length:381 start_codon:yes stop_codon:yes gene_type:complete